MDARIQVELALLRSRFPAAEYKDHWVRVPGYPLPAGWSRRVSDTAFYIRDSYIASGPYGIYVPTGLTHDGGEIKNFAAIAPTQPPFGGQWSIFSWESEGWHSSGDPSAGHNLLTFVLGFGTRFREGL
jgi:hypothetical protein